jgi:hypothetical protein
VITVEPRTGVRHVRVGTVVRVAAVVAVAAVTLLVVNAAGPPPTVAGLEIRNPRRVAVSVEVSGGGRDGWTPVVTVDRGTSTRAERVVDQGDTWVFRFRSGPDELGEVVRSREDLERSGWRVDTPPSGDRLERDRLG